jgi:hypothetical protein
MEKLHEKLLDMLHEDINRVNKQPCIEEEEGRRTHGCRTR